MPPPAPARGVGKFGGTLASGSVTDQAWLAAHESAAKLLVKLPFSLPQPDQARNVKLTVDAQGTGDLEQAFVWDGTNWRFLASFDFSASTPHILVTTSGPATSLLQDGNIYLLFINLDRVQFNFGTGPFTVPVSIDRLKATVDFQ